MGFISSEDRVLRPYTAGRRSTVAFINKFLLDQNVSTDMWSTNNQFNGVSWVPSNWIDWTTPKLT